MNDTFFRKLKERQGILKELGINEKKNILVSGLIEEQLKLLDDEYVKSLQLVPIRSHTEIKEENPADTDLNTPSSNLPAPSQIMPAPEQKTEVPMGQPQIQTPASPTPAPSSPLPMPAPMPVPEAPKSERPMQLEDAPPEELTPTPDAGKNKTI
jgi:hypothetical protein